MSTDVVANMGGQLKTLASFRQRYWLTLEVRLEDDEWSQIRKAVTGRDE
jgi:hypothetical protein